MKRFFLFNLLLTLTIFGKQAEAQVNYKTQAYDPTWESIIRHPTPDWFKDAKFGIYFHWGPYSVPAAFSEWYPRNMYIESSMNFTYHEKTWGPQDEFGYKDFIPLFTAEKFNADEWVDLFVKSGAKFIGPVAEHHDGFAMWNSKLTEWDAYDMGPKRDITGELAEAARKRGLKFMVSFHHARKWKQYEYAYAYDAKNPHYAGLYGKPHFPGEPEPREFLEEWLGKIVEVIDGYQPDYIWFDFGWAQPTFEPYKRAFLSYYYNKSQEWGKGVVVSYKHDHLPLGAGVLDLERGRLDSLREDTWITDTSIDKNSWCYIDKPNYKDVNTMVDNLVDRVSKNGNTLMNIAPKADGTIPEQQKELLLGIGKWLGINGEAIYGTRHWYKYGEGPTQFEGGSFIDKKAVNYTARDIRFTTKGQDLYAITLDWPANEVLVESFSTLDPEMIHSVTLLGHTGTLKWEVTSGGLKIEVPDNKPCEHAYAFKVAYKERLPWVY